MDNCSYPECQNRSVRRGLCHGHYRLDLAGIPLRPLVKKGRPRVSDDGAAKTCTTCHQMKPLDGYQNATDGLLGKRSRCRECTAGHDRARRDDPEKRAEYAARNSRVAGEFREWLWAEKSKPCTDCGGTFHPVAMDYDHLPGFVKEFEIGMAAAGRSRAAVLAEMAKCELVCANCHRVRTHQRR